MLVFTFGINIGCCSWPRLLGDRIEQLRIWERCTLCLSYSLSATGEKMMGRELCHQTRDLVCSRSRVKTQAKPFIRGCFANGDGRFV